MMRKPPYKQTTNLTADLEVKCWETLDLFPEDMKVEPDAAFCFAFTFSVGEVEEDGSDLFQAMVMSPDISRKKENRYVRRLVLHELDVPKLKAEIERIVRDAGRKDAYNWAHELNKRFYWEYDQYRG